MLLQLILNNAQNVIEPTITISNLIVGGVAVGGSSTAVTIAVMQAKLKYYKEELDKVRTKLNTHISESIVFSETVAQLKNDMGWIKEALLEIKGKF